MSRRRPFGLGLTAALLSTLVGVGCSRPAPEPAALEIPHPDLAGAAAGVREQIGSRRAALEALLDEETPPDAAVGEAVGRLGLLYVTYGFHDAALSCFRHAERLQPEDYRWPYLLAYVHLTDGRPQEAIPLFDRSLELYPDFLPAMLRRGRAHLALGDYSAARRSFDRALELESRSAAAFEGLGRVEAALEKTTASVDHFAKAVELEPRANSLHYALAQAYRKLGDLDRARSHLEESGDAPVPIPDPLIDPLAQLGESAQFYLIQGGEALDDRNYEGAAAAYERALEEDPTSFVAHRGLSYSLEKIGDLQGSITQMTEALQLIEGSSTTEELAEGHRILGGLLAVDGRDREALEQYRRSLELEPDQPGVRFKLANAAARSGQFEEAVGHYDRLLESRPEHAATFLVARATALVNLGRGEAAIADFERAVELDPDNPQLRLRFSRALDHLGRARQATEERAAAVRVGGEGEQRVRLLAESARQQSAKGDFEGAVASLREALQLDPERADLRYELASILGHLGRYEEGLSQFRRVIDEAPRHAGARRGEITILILDERYREARERLQEALRLFPREAQLAHVQARLLVTAPDPGARDGELGLEIARRLSAERRSVRVRETLALALAETGRFAEAAELQRRLVEEAERSGDGGLARVLRAELAAFEAGRAWFASSPDEILGATLGSG